jgi:uracil-DNA glycosylase
MFGRGATRPLQGCGRQTFVGPVGKIMDRALEKAGIDRKQVYVTNAVNHFKWELRGKKTHSSETELARNRRLPSVVGSGAATR